MMSMSTRSIPEVFFKISIACRPSSARRTMISQRSSMLVRANMFRTSSSTIRTFLPASSRSDCGPGDVLPGGAWNLASIRWRNRAVLSIRCSSDRASLTIVVSAISSSRYFSSWVRSRPV